MRRVGAEMNTPQMYRITVHLRKERKTISRSLIVCAPSTNRAKELVSDFILRRYGSYEFDFYHVLPAQESVFEVGDGQGFLR